MRRGLSVILSVMLLLGLAACGRAPVEEAQPERYLVREAVQTVYGVEAPAAGEEQVFQLAAAADPAAQPASAALP